MDNTISNYLGELQSLLSGKIPPEELVSILQETESHLYDLKEELGSEDLALKKFGSVEAFADDILSKRNGLSAWKASVWPVGVLLGGMLLTLVLSRIPAPFHPSPFASVTYGYFVDLALPYLFFFACLKAKRLIPVQIAFCLVAMGCIGILSSIPRIPVNTDSTPDLGHARPYGFLRITPHYQLVPKDEVEELRDEARFRLASSRRAAAHLDREAVLVASGSPEARLKYVGPGWPGHYATVGYPLPAAYTEYAKFCPGSRVRPDSYGIGIVPGVTGVTSFDEAKPYWTPAAVQDAHKSIDSMYAQSQQFIAEVPGLLNLSLSRRLWLSALAFSPFWLEGFIRFFAINLLAWIVVKAFNALRRLRRKRTQTAN